MSGPVQVVFLGPDILEALVVARDNFRVDWATLFVNWSSDRTKLVVWHKLPPLESDFLEVAKR
jgi:hypothetical protein